MRVLKGKLSSVDGVLVISSSERVISLLDVCYGGRKCSPVGTCSNISTFRGLRRGTSVRLVVLSIVVPGGSNVSMIERLQRRGGPVPVLVLDTGSTSVSGVRKLAANTSSCISGPFGPLRIVTHVGSLLHEAAVRTSTTRISSVRVNPLVVGGSSRRMGALGKGDVRLATLRFNVLRLLTDRPGHIFDTSRVFRHI